MKKFVSVLLLSLPMVAAAASNCDEISATIAEKITNNGVLSNQFQLKTIPADQTQQVEGQIVGSCDRGQQNIVYVRLDGVSASSTPVTSTKSEKTPETTPETAPEAAVVQPKVDEPAEVPVAAPTESQQPQSESSTPTPATN